MYLDGPNAVQLKYKCLVSNGNKNEYERIKCSHHEGSALELKTKGS